MGLGYYFTDSGWNEQLYGRLDWGASWSSALGGGEEWSGPRLPLTELSGKLAEKVPFPNDVERSPSYGYINVIQNTDSWVLPEYTIYNAHAEHRRFWLHRFPATATEARMTVLLSRRRQINHGAEFNPWQQDGVRAQTLIIPAGETTSNAVDSTPEFTQNFAPPWAASFYSESVEETLLPVEIVVRKKWGTVPSNGVLVKKGDVLEIALDQRWVGQPKQFENQIRWEYRQMALNGTFGSWVPFGDDGKGTKFEYTTAESGIFELKAVVGDGGGSSGEVFYTRRNDDRYSSHKKGENDCFGVVDADWQLNVREQALINLGNKAYARGVANGPIPAGPPVAGSVICSWPTKRLMQARGSNGSITGLQSSGKYILRQRTSGQESRPRTSRIGNCYLMM